MLSVEDQDDGDYATLVLTRWGNRSFELAELEEMDIHRSALLL